MGSNVRRRRDRQFSVGIDLLSFEGARMESRDNGRGGSEVGIYIPCDINGLEKSGGHLYATFDAFRRIHGKASHSLYLLHMMSKRARFILEGRVYPATVYPDVPYGSVFPREAGKK